MLVQSWRTSGVRAAPILLAAAAVSGCSVEKVSVTEGTRRTYVITDVQGQAWDVTSAAYDYGMDPDRFEHGLGKNAITPLENPVLLSPGDRGYPGDDASFLVIGARIGGDARAYGKLDVIRHEVVDEVIDGAHVAVTY
jgi:hypothetical protein